MRILLIGGTGFIGEYVTKELARLHHKVYVVHKSPLKAKNKFGGVRYFRTDLNLQNTQLKRIFKRVDVLVTLIQPDLRQMKNVILAARGAKELKKIVYLSTLLLYPDSASPQKETAAPKPVTQYERKKYKEESMISRFAKKENYPLTVLRVATVYGDVKNKGIVNRVFLSLIRRDDLTIRGGRSNLNLRDYIFVEDAAKLIAFFILSKQKKPLEVINISTGRGYSVHDLVGRIEAITGGKAEFKTGKPISDKNINIGDNKKMKALSQYKFKHNLTTGLKKTYKNYLKIYS